MPGTERKFKPGPVKTKIPRLYTLDIITINQFDRLARKLNKSEILNELIKGWVKKELEKRKNDK